MISRLSQFLFLLLAAAVLPAFAQQLPFQHYAQKEGLGSLAITALAQDGKGYIWVGTENGLYRYNGAEFRRYGAAEGLLEPPIYALHVDRKGVPWVGNKQNLYRLVDDRLEPVLLNKQRLPLWPGQVLAETTAGTMLAISDGKLYQIGAAGGSVNVKPYFAPAQLQAHPDLRTLNSIHADGDGSLWLGCGETVCRVENGKVVRFGHLPPAQWTSILRDRSGAVWVRSQHLVYALEPGARSFATRSIPPHLTRKRTLRTELREGADGAMLTNADPGLLRWHKDGQWRLIDAENGLDAGGGVTAVLIDRDRGAWLGTRGRGLVRWLGYDQWENWTRAQGLPEDVILSLLRDEGGRLHVGTRSGHAQMQAGTSRFSTVPVPESLSGHQWAGMALDRQGRVWAGTYSGLLVRYTADSAKTELMARMGAIFELFSDREGLIWIASEAGLFTVPENAPPGTAPTPPAIASHPEALSRVMAGCSAPDGQLWFLAETHLLHRQAGVLRALPLPSELSSADLLACGAGGELWAAGEGVLWQLRPGAAVQARRIEEPFLRHRGFFNMHLDSRGWLWIGTDAGVVVWNRERWAVFDQTHGLAWDDINGQGFYEDRDRSIWIATSNGLSHVTRPERLFDGPTPSPMIEMVKRGDRTVALGTSPLPWSREPLSFKLASLVYQDRQSLRYRYRLIDLEDQWNESPLSEVRYASLPPGDYRFQYTVVHSGTGATVPPREIRFSISPPWWRTTAFYALCAVLTLATVLALHHLRLRSLTRRQAELARLVAERTRELEKSQDELRTRALKDALTRVWNRGAIMEILDRELEKGLRTGERFVLVLLDLDHFKRINDTYGHAAGDSVLVEAARRLSAAVRPYDAVGRYGGEEFVVLLAAIGPDAAMGRVAALREALRGTPVDIGEGQALTVTASFGVTAFDPQQPAGAAELLRHADEALYRAKGEGRDRIVSAPAKGPAPMKPELAPRADT